VKKIFRINLIIALLLFAVLLTVQAVVFSIIRSEPVEALRQNAADQVVATISYFTIPVTVLFSLIPCAHFASLYKKKPIYYLKRMWELIAFLIVIDFGISFAWDMVTGMVFTGTFFDFMTGDITLAGIIGLKTPVFILYMVITYRLVFWHFGQKHARNHIYNLHFLIITLMYTFMFHIPVAFSQTIIETTNLHTVFTPQIKSENNFFNLFLILSLLATLVIEAFVLTLAYRRGKRSFLDDRVSDTPYETDEQPDEGVKQGSQP